MNRTKISTLLVRIAILLLLLILAIAISAAAMTFAPLQSGFSSLHADTDQLTELINPVLAGKDVS